MADKGHETEQAASRFVPDGPDALEQARRLHHLATADPEPERDGTMTGPAHEEKYGLERAQASADYWRAVGVHPIENRALQPGEDGYVEPGAVEVDASQSAPENASSKQADSKAVPPSSN